jgi:phospholipid/cholesterol/gamma-HCH transport system ATP-binding protein
VDPRPPDLDVVFNNVALSFDEKVVLRDITFSIPRGEMRILLGASGAGKTVMLKMMLGLMRPDSGAVFVHGARVDQMSEAELLHVREDIGMVFQENALFDSLTVAENVGFQLSEAGRLPREAIDARVEEILGFVGLSEYGDRLPAELSGGQRRRVAIARALAPKPSLLLFDDPTSGLDPIIATSVIDEIVKIRDMQHVTTMIVTHQIRDAFYIATHEAVSDGTRVTVVPTSANTPTRARFMVLLDGRIHFEGTGDELLNADDAYLRKFLFMTLPPW